MEEEEYYSELNLSKLQPSNQSERQEHKQSKLAKKSSKTKRIEKEDIQTKKKKSKIDDPQPRQENNKKINKQLKDE